MSYALFVYIGHTLQNLFHIAFDIFDWNSCESRDLVSLFDSLGSFLCFLDNFLEVLVAKFKNKVLSGFSVITSTVENLQHFNDIFALSQSIENLIFSAYILSGLLSSFHGNCLLRLLVECFEYVTYIFEILIRFFCLLTKGSTPDDSLGLQICVG